MGFWWMAVALVVLALVCVLLPLRRLNLPAQDRLEPAPRAKHRKLAGLLLLGMPLVSWGLYQHLGAPSIAGEPQIMPARGRHDVDGMLTALEAKLKTQPDDAQTLYVLGRSYLLLQRQTEAEALLSRAVKLAPKEARMLSQYAEILAMNADGDLQGAASPWIEQALELDDQDAKALELAGLAAYQRHQWAQAAHFWRRLLRQLPSESEFHQDMTRAIEEAEAKAALESGLGDRARLQPPEKKPNPH